MKGLKEGKQTKITELVKKETGKIKGKGLDYLINVLKYIKRNYQFSRESRKKYPQRTRTAEELIKSKIMTGCTDFAHLCLVLLRAKKIPALYVETFDKNWLEKPNEHIQGHIFVEAKIGKEKYILDPTAGDINFIGRYKQYKVMTKGIDYLTLFPNKEIYEKRVKEHFKIKF